MLTPSWVPDDIPPEKWKPANRASGESLCSVCGKPFDKHYKPARQTCPTLIVTCDHRWLKL